VGTCCARDLTVLRLGLCAVHMADFKSGLRPRRRAIQVPVVNSIQPGCRIECIDAASGTQSRFCVREKCPSSSRQDRPVYYDWFRHRFVQ
ncbi:hypothetical protein BaRGS_00036845, partial [Batillaria attramentaria]